MNKLPKFLVATNEMINNEQYIIHTQEPKFIAKVIKTNTLELLELQKNITVEIDGQRYNMGSQTRFDGQLYGLFVIEFLTKPDLSDIDKTGSGGLMSRMGDWWHAYLKFKKQKDDKKSNTGN